MVSYKCIIIYCGSSLGGLIKFILSMNQEGNFTFGSEPNLVQLSREEVRKAKDYLKFEPKSEYYLRIPNKQFLPLVIFCLTARQSTLTKAIKNISQKFKKNYWPHITQDFLAHNQKRNIFIAPYQLEILASKLSYLYKLVQQCSKQFKLSNISHSLSEFKKKDKVIVNYLAQNKPLGDKIPEENAETIYLIEDRDEFIICAFSANQKKVRKEERNSVDSQGQGQKIGRKLSEKTQPSKQPLKRANVQEQPFIQQQQFNLQLQEKAEEKRYHTPFTVVLVIILAVFIYCAFYEIPSNLYEGVQPIEKPIIDYLIDSIDSVAKLLRGQE